MSEFLEVFSNDLYDFGIDLLPEKNSNSIPPYQMAPNELKELKSQLIDLLEKFFLRPNISLWGSLVFFVKNKDVY